MCGKGLTNGGEWWYYGGIKNAARKLTFLLEKECYNQNIENIRFHLGGKV